LKFSVFLDVSGKQNFLLDLILKPENGGSFPLNFEATSIVLRVDDNAYEGILHIVVTVV
jgi:hypothetical protein